MNDFLHLNQTSGPITTVTSESEGRLKVDAKGMKKEKKSILKKVLKKLR